MSLDGQPVSISPVGHWDHPFGEIFVNSLFALLATPLLLLCSSQSWQNPCYVVLSFILGLLEKRMKRWLQQKNKSLRLSAVIEKSLFPSNFELLALCINWHLYINVHRGLRKLKALILKSSALRLTRFWKEHPGSSTQDAIVSLCAIIPTAFKHALLPQISKPHLQ